MTPHPFRPATSLALLAALAAAVAAATPAAAAGPPLSPTPRAVTLASAEVAVPMDAAAGAPIVEVEIGGRGPFRFLLDTGAGTTVLDLSLVRELGLPEIGATRIGDPADPQGIEARVVAINSLRLGGATFHDLTAAAWDRAGLRPGADAPRGVLGIPLFADLLLTLDYPGARIVLARGSLPAPDGGEVVAVHRGEGGGLPAVELVVAGRTVEATLDTGASGAISFPSRYAAELPLAGEPAVLGRGRMAGGETVIRGATLAGDVRLGSHRLERPLVAFNDRLTHVNLGSRFLAGFAVTLDTRNGRARFRAAPAAPALDAASLAAYAGNYGVRRVTSDGERLLVQRLSGPQGPGPVVPLEPAGQDAFALAGERAPRFRFERDAAGRVVALEVLTPEGRWERAAKDG